MYFSQRFNVSAIKMRSLGVFNPQFSVDNKMFVDPKLLEHATEEFDGAHADLHAYFYSVITLLKVSKTRGDLPWVSACKRMQFKETSNTALGFSASGTNGNGIGKVLAGKIVTRANEILPHVDFVPDVFELIGVFAEKVGCDRLSDMLVSILMRRFLTYTDRITRELGVGQTSEVKHMGLRYVCPRYKHSKPLILVPRSILKPLPVALDIEQALDNADLNQQTRSEVNRILDEARKYKVRPSKNDLRAVIRANPSCYKEIIDGYKRAAAVSYDFDTDPANVADYGALANEIVGTKNAATPGLSAEQRVEACVAETIGHFTHSVEQNRLSDLLFDDEGHPRRELFAQRLLYSIAAIFGKLYNVDVSREGNAGAGAVDFRFTVGQQNRLLVELKLSSHERLKDGYYEQLPAYGKAEGIARMILVVIIVDSSDNLGKLLDVIKKRKLPIDLKVVDATPKPSASKRRTDN